MLSLEASSKFKFLSLIACSANLPKYAYTVTLFLENKTVQKKLFQSAQLLMKKGKDPRRILIRIHTLD
jgi:hypothetical protein